MHHVDRGYPTPPDPANAIPATYLINAITLAAVLKAEGIKLDAVVEDVSQQVRNSVSKNRPD